MNNNLLYFKDELDLLVYFVSLFYFKNELDLLVYFYLKDE
jgi:hypothetical protein